jgi:hypothetical protein
MMAQKAVHAMQSPSKRWWACITDWPKQPKTFEADQLTHPLRLRPLAVGPAVRYGCHYLGDITTVRHGRPLRRVGSEPNTSATELPRGQREVLISEAGVRLAWPIAITRAAQQETLWVWRTQ